jgi:hypothetical protein
MEHEIILQPISVVHGIGECKGVILPSNLFATSEKKLRIEGVCSVCGRGVYDDLLITDIVKHCPPSPESDQVPEFTEANIAWLKDMRVSVEEPRK